MDHTSSSELALISAVELSADDAAASDVLTNVDIMSHTAVPGVSGDVLISSVESLANSEQSIARNLSLKK